MTPPRRVVLIGAESTGKTTLARLLAEQFQTNWVAEYGREHWETKVAGLQMTDPSPIWSPQDFVHIATEQQRREISPPGRPAGCCSATPTPSLPAHGTSGTITPAMPRSTRSVPATRQTCTC